MCFGILKMIWKNEEVILSLFDHAWKYNQFYIDWNFRDYFKNQASPIQAWCGLFIETPEIYFL